MQRWTYGKTNRIVESDGMEQWHSGYLTGRIVYEYGVVRLAGLGCLDLWCAQSWIFPCYIKPTLVWDGDAAKLQLAGPASACLQLQCVQCLPDLSRLYFTRSYTLPPGLGSADDECHTLPQL